MSKDDKAGPVKNEAELELEELAAEDDGSQLNDEDEEKESEEEETEEEEGSDAKGETRERDPKTGRFKPVKQDKKTKDDVSEEEEEESEEEEEGDETEEPEESEEDEGAEEETESEEDRGPKSRSAQKIKTLVESRNKMRDQIARLEGQLEVLTKTGKGAADDTPAKIKTAKDVAAEHKAELDELYEKVEEARADSNVKEAAKLQRRIDEIKDAIADAKNSENEVKSRAAARQELENERFNTARDYLFKVRPVLDPDSADFDQRVYNEMAFQVDAYEKAGLTPYAALRRASRLIFIEDPFERPTADEDTGAKNKKEKPTKQTDVPRNIASAKKQPPRGGKHTQDEGTGETDIDSLTDEELLALPASKLARLDGSLG